MNYTITRQDTLCMRCEMYQQTHVLLNFARYVEDSLLDLFQTYRYSKKSSLALALPKRIPSPAPELMVLKESHTTPFYS